MRRCIGTALTVAGCTLVFASAASAHSPLLHVKGATLSQARNAYAHDRYVCNNGRGHNRWFHCQAMQWAKATIKRLTPRPVQRTARIAWYWLCIYSHENAGYGWGANTGNGYYGGLQMDLEFQRDHGASFLRRWGTANNWPVWAQVAAAEHARRSRGFAPWPNTARMCGLL